MPQSQYTKIHLMTAIAIVIKLKFIKVVSQKIANDDKFNTKLLYSHTR